MYYSKSKNGFFTPEIHSNLFINQVTTDPVTGETLLIRVEPDPNGPIADAVEITNAQHTALFDAQTQGKIITSDKKGYPVAIDPTPPTAAELLELAVNAVRNGLQSAIDDRAKALGFSGGNALMLYAGFTNAFQSMAQTFATWEASVWVEADAYKAEVIGGTKPMLTATEAVALMPVYPL